MSNIVERLREAFEKMPVEGDAIWGLCGEAAAEIEQLRDQLAHSGRERDVFTAEIVRLRAVPEQLAKMLEGYSAGQIRMAAGEMTAQEMRSVQAAQRWWASAIRHKAEQLINQQSTLKENR